MTGVSRLKFRFSHIEPTAEEERKEGGMEHMETIKYENTALETNRTLIERAN